eukprot:3072277-Heterocapsa_arctica.AAC.1
MKLKAVGFSAQELKYGGVGAQEPKDAGFRDAQELKHTGFSVPELKAAGVIAFEEHVGSTAQELKREDFGGQG